MYLWISRTLDLADMLGPILQFFCTRLREDEERQRTHKAIDVGHFGNWFENSTPAFSFLSFQVLPHHYFPLRTLVRFQLQLGTFHSVLLRCFLLLLVLQLPCWFQLVILLPCRVDLLILLLLLCFCFWLAGFIVSNISSS